MQAPFIPNGSEEKSHGNMRSARLRSPVAPTTRESLGVSRRAFCHRVIGSTSVELNVKKAYACDIFHRTASDSHLAALLQTQSGSFAVL